MLLAPPRDAILSAKVPVRERLRRDPRSWLVSLAVRAIKQCLEGTEIEPRTTALLLSLPDEYREHPALSDGSGELFAGIQSRMGARFHSTSTVSQQGRAGPLADVGRARELLRSGVVAQCIVGGVDSLTNGADASRLSQRGRLHEPGNPQGAIPGEGAAFVLLSVDSPCMFAGSGVEIQGIGQAMEADCALTDRFGVGCGLSRALSGASEDAGISESSINFRVSDMNGERYHAWDSMLASARYYRTRREALPVWYPAASVGDIGADAGPLAIVVAATSLSHGYSPGPVAMCETSSDAGLRGTCLVIRAADAESPP